MIHFLKGCPKLFWCNCSAVWWCSESNILHPYYYLCQRFIKGLMWWIRIHNHQSKLNRTALLVITRSPYQPLTKAIFSTFEICGNILNIFWGGIKNTKSLYKIHWGDLICNILLEIVVCFLLCLVLEISDIGFIEGKAHVMWHISREEAGIYHFHCMFKIYG